MKTVQDDAGRLAWLAAADPLTVGLATQRLDDRSVHLDDPYVDQFWLSILGPSTLAAARYFVHRLREGPELLTVSHAEFGAEIGVGSSSAQLHTLDRMCRWHFARVEGDVLRVKAHTCFLSMVQVDRLPRRLRHLHAGLS